MWSEELIDEDADRLVAARHGEVLEHLDQHLGVDRVAGLGPLEAQQGDALLVDLVAGRASRVAHRRAGTYSLEDAGARSRRRHGSTSASTSSRGSRKRPST